MGVYDSYGAHDEQLKVGECTCQHYTVGMRVPSVADGIYCGYDRAIVIAEGVFVADIPLTQIYDKWGDRIPIDIESSNQLELPFDEIEKAHETRENLVDKNGK